MVALLLLFVAACFGSLPAMVEPSIVYDPNYKLIATAASGISHLFEIQNSGYAKAPQLVRLKGSRYQIGYDYADLLHGETSAAFTAFMDSEFNMEDQELLKLFLTFCWDRFLSPHVPRDFIEELEGMAAWHKANPGASTLQSDKVASMFYTIANLPADPPNIIAMLEEDLEPASWPWWLKDGINDIIRIIEKLTFGCDSYGVWGSRTKNGKLYTSRNLDWQTNTGIDGFKLVIVYEINNIKPYASIGFAVGLGALAGQSTQGITTSEMNLDNSVVTFFGAPFPLRLRMVMEGATDLQSAMQIWNATNNTNSFNFMIGSAKDERSTALETIRGFTQFYGADSDIERNARYMCYKDECHKWTNETGEVKIGFPLPDAVWRTNHAFSFKIMQTQEPLFNDTVFRYMLQHDLINDLGQSKTLIDDEIAVSIAATLGTKGRNFLTCNQDYTHGENVMSIAYAPGARLDETGRQSQLGYFYIAWEEGKGSGVSWVPAACNFFVKIDFDRVVALTQAADQAFHDPIKLPNLK